MSATVLSLTMFSHRQPGKHNVIQGNSVRWDEELRKNVAHRYAAELNDF